MRRYREEGAWDDRPLGRFVADSLQVDPGRRMRIWSPARPHLGTVGEVYGRAQALAGGLPRLGVGAGDVVAFQLPNWMEAVATFYAVAMLGAVVVPIVHFYGPKEVRFILGQSGASTLVVAARYGERDYPAELAAVRAELPALRHVVVVAGPPLPGAHGFDDLCAGAPRGRPRRGRPGGAGADRLHLGDHRGPQGGGPLPPHHRL